MLRICFYAAMAIAATVSTSSALAQQGGSQPKPPQIPQGQTITKPLVVPPNAVIKPAPAAPARDPFEVARTTDVTLQCLGPLRLEVVQADPHDGSKGVGMKLIFKEATSASNIPAGSCWRQGGFMLAGITADGVSLNAGKGKGEIFHNPDLLKCPLMKSFALEGGKLVDPKVNDGTIAYMMIDYATQTGPLSFQTKWVDHKGGVPVGSTATGYGRYTMSFGDAVTPGVPGCRR